MTTPKKIYLMDTGTEDGWVWCKDPAPGTDQDPTDSVEYVRADTLDTMAMDIARWRAAYEVDNRLPGEEFEQETVRLAETYVEEVRTLLGRVHDCHEVPDRVRELEDALEQIEAEMQFPNQLESGFVHGKPKMVDYAKRVETAKFIARQTLNR